MNDAYNKKYNLHEHYIETSKNMKYKNGMFLLKQHCTKKCAIHFFTHDS